MNPIQNIHFTILIRLNRGQSEFNFRQRSDDSYDADTSDERGNRYYFKVLVNESNMSIMGANLPEWLTDNQSLIIKSLKDKINFLAF